MKTISNFARSYQKTAITGSATIFLVLLTVTLFAQDGNAGINEATNKVKGYFDTGTDLMYAIGAVVGLVGAMEMQASSFPNV